MIFIRFLTNVFESILATIILITLLLFLTPVGWIVLIMLMIKALKL